MSVIFQKIVRQDSLPDRDIDFHLEQIANGEHYQREPLAFTGGRFYNEHDREIPARRRKRKRS